MGENMNRDLRRSMQRKTHDQKVISYDANKIITHNKVKQAMDEGIIMGFYCAVKMIGDVCDQVNGIGEKRKQEMIRLYNQKMLNLKERLHKGEV